MLVSLKTMYIFAKKDMKPKHCVSNWSYCNQTVQHQIHHTNCTTPDTLHKLYNTSYIRQTVQHQIHYTNSEQFETVLNDRIIAIGYVKWEKFVSCFRWRIHQRSGKHIVTKYICPRAVCHNESKYMKCLRLGKFCEVAFMLFAFSKIT
jgi:hypothetical protein